MVCGNVVAYSAKFALDRDPLVVVRGGIDGIEWRSALRISVVVIIVPITGSVVVPPGRSVDESRRVHFSDMSGNVELRIIPFCNLAPTFVIDDLFHVSLETLPVKEMLRTHV